jgi:predicted amidohydrolase
VNRKTNPEIYEKSVLFLACNRVGSEENAVKDSKMSKDKICTFAGCSCAVKLNPNELVYFLEKKEGVLKAECLLE